MRLELILVAIAAGILGPAELRAQARPPEPYVDRDVCPFECCIYREWVARSPIVAYAQAERGGAAVFRLRPGEPFSALGGDIHLLRVGVAVATDTVRLHGDSLRPSVQLAPGDTVYVLSYLGEGAYNVWFRGARYETFGFWPEPGTEGKTSVAMGAVPVGGTLLRAPTLDWWVKARNARGQTGWILMDDAEVDGEDLCA